MKLAPGTPLQISLMVDEAQPAVPIGRLAMAGGLAQLEWSVDTIQHRRRVDPLLYAAELCLQAARGRAFEGLHGFLADSLPDAWGRLLMKRRLEKLGVRTETLTVVDRLALVGTNGRGALVYEPATAPTDDVDAIDLDALAEQSHALLLGREGTLLDTLARLGGASGGGRPKVHISSDDGEWIVKFRAIYDPVDIGPVEQAYAVMARAAGIAVAETRLLPSNAGPGWFAARRFDRPEPGRRLHMLSLAGAVEAVPDMPSIDYDGFLRATMAITRHAADVTEAFRRMVFNVLACNRDDHARQHSYLMGPDGDWRLAPAYDLTYSAGPAGEHYMAVEGEGRAPTRAHVTALGRRHGLSPRMVADVIDAVRAAIADWPRIAVEAGVDLSRGAIDRRLADVDRVFG